MPAQFRIQRKKRVRSGYSAANIAKPLRLGTKNGRYRQNAAHGPQFSLALNATRQHHKAPALGIDGHALPCPQRQLAQQGRSAQGCHMVFGKAAAKIQAVHLRPASAAIPAVPAVPAVSGIPVIPSGQQGKMH